MSLIPKDTNVDVFLAQIFLHIDDAKVTWLNDKKTAIKIVISGIVTSDVVIIDKRSFSIHCFDINHSQYLTSFSYALCRCVYTYDCHNKTMIYLSDGSKGFIAKDNYVLSANPLNNKRYRMYEDGQAYHPETGICLAKIIEQAPEPPGA